MIRWDNSARGEKPFENDFKIDLLSKTYQSTYNKNRAWDAVENFTMNFDAVFMYRFSIIRSGIINLFHQNQLIRGKDIVI